MEVKMAHCVTTVEKPSNLFSPIGDKKDINVDKLFPIHNQIEFIIKLFPFYHQLES